MDFVVELFKYDLMKTNIFARKFKKLSRRSLFDSMTGKLV